LAEASHHPPRGAAYLDGKAIAVAGATGLAGSSVIRRLLERHPGARIRGAHFGGDGCFIEDPRIDYLRLDLRRPEDCHRLFVGCDCAILAAAVSGGAAQTVAEPWRQVTDNLVMDAVLLDALHSAAVGRAVFISSATVYPERDGALREDDLDWNRDPPEAYLGVGWAKRAAEKLCQFWHRKTGIEIVIARAANIFGPYARFDPARANFIPALIRKAVDRQEPFEVWSGPEVARDVIYGDDFGDAVIALANASEIHFDTFNVGSGRLTTIGEVVTWVLRQVDHSPAIRWRADAPGTIRTRLLDCDKLRRMTGWHARIGVEEGVRRTVTWWEANKDRWTR
jgi:nucleoside-diphosphate-sugar epimerase